MGFQDRLIFLSLRMHNLNFVRHFNVLIATLSLCITFFFLNHVKNWTYSRSLLMFDKFKKFLYKFYIVYVYIFMLFNESMFFFKSNSLYRTLKFNEFRVELAYFIQILDILHGFQDINIFASLFVSFYVISTKLAFIGVIDSNPMIISSFKVCWLCPSFEANTSHVDLVSFSWISLFHWIWS